MNYVGIDIDSASPSPFGLLVPRSLFAYGDLRFTSLGSQEALCVERTE